MAEKKKEIPHSVIALANQKGFNAIKFETYIDGYGNVYSIYFDDGTPYPMPLGRPKYIIDNGKSLAYYNDQDFKLSRLLYS